MRKRLCSVSRPLYRKFVCKYVPQPSQACNYVPPPVSQICDVAKINEDGGGDYFKYTLPSEWDNNFGKLVGAVGFSSAIWYFVETYKNWNHPTLKDVMAKLEALNKEDTPEKGAPARAPTKAPANTYQTPVEAKPIKKLPANPRVDAPDRAIILDRSPKVVIAPARAPAVSAPAAPSE